MGADIRPCARRGKGGSLPPTRQKSRFQPHDRHPPRHPGARTQRHRRSVDAGPRSNRHHPALVRRGRHRHAGLHPRCGQAGAGPGQDVLHVHTRLDRTARGDRDLGIAAIRTHDRPRPRDGTGCRHDGRSDRAAMRVRARRQCAHHIADVAEHLSGRARPRRRAALRSPVGWNERRTLVARSRTPVRRRRPPHEGRVLRLALESDRLDHERTRTARDPRLRAQARHRRDLGRSLHAHRLRHARALVRRHSRPRRRRLRRQQLLEGVGNDGLARRLAASPATPRHADGRDGGLQQHRLSGIRPVRRARSDHEGRRVREVATRPLPRRPRDRREVRCKPKSDQLVQTRGRVLWVPGRRRHDGFDRLR